MLVVVAHAVGVAVGVGVGTGVAVGFGVAVGTGVGFGVGAGVAVGFGVGVAVGFAVGEGDGAGVWSSQPHQPLTCAPDVMASCLPPTMISPLTTPLESETLRDGAKRIAASEDFPVSVTSCPLPTTSNMTESGEMPPARTMLLAPLSDSVPCTRISTDDPAGASMVAVDEFSTTFCTSITFRPLRALSV